MTIFSLGRFVVTVVAPGTYGEVAPNYLRSSLSSGANASAARMAKEIVAISSALVHNFLFKLCP
jgi:hypothetical protein